MLTPNVAGMRTRHDVLFYVPNVGPLLRPGHGLPAGGAETQVALVARELARRGMRVAIVVHDAGLPSSIDGLDLIVQRGLRSRLPGVRSLEAFGRTVAAIVRAGAPVVVQCNASVETGYVAFASRLTRRRFVYSTVNVVDLDFGRIEPSRLRVWAFHAGVRIADEVVAQTAEQVELIQGRFGRDARLVQCVSEPAPAGLRSPEAFLWIGRLAVYKHPQAYLDLAEAVPEALFRMVGVPSGPDGPRLAAAVAARAASLPNVELLEPRPREQLAPLYDSAVAVVNTAEFEGMPNIFLEGWARGVPALALKHDPDGMIVRDRLGAFAGGDPVRLAEQARELWAGRANRSELAERCVAHMAEHHSLEAVADGWVDALRGAEADA
jgi:glycosyltransferase involved in cell wall biosynthesis